MALSMDEQRILDGMEHKLADDDPRLASRLAAFGQPRLPAMLGSSRARAVAVLISLALAAVVTLMVYSMRPFPAGSGKPGHPAQRSPGVTSTSNRASAPAPAISKPSKPNTSSASLRLSRGSYASAARP
ncbi:MAG TPA: DUF3040 domain-containing protein [Streptosporangiaceae bacterium]|nr:DUF3040 domain-containing protein [Streptosporangiaceae bacterium]